MTLWPLVCLLALVHSIALGYPEVRFSHLDMEHGLSQSSIHVIGQDADGYIWIGTQYGLDRFDGYQFRSFGHEPDDDESLRDGRINDLLVSRRGHLWVVTDYGLDRVDPRSGRVERIEPGFRGVAAPQQRSGMVEDDQGNLLVSGTTSIHYLPHDSLELLELAFPIEEDFRLTRSTGSVLDGKQQNWVANRLGLWVLNPDQLKFEQVATARPPESLSVRPGLVRAGAGRLIYSDAYGLKLIDAEARRVVRRVDPTDHGFSASQVDAIAAAGDGTVWLLLPEALVRSDADLQRWDRVAKLPPFRHPGDAARHRLEVAIDGQGMHWLAGQFGVALYDPHLEVARLYQHDSRDPHSLVPTTANVGYGVFADDQGTVWIGSGLGGVSRFVPQSTRFTHIQEAVAGPPGTGENIVRAVREQVHGGQVRLWSGLDGTGVRLWVRSADGRYEVARSYRVAAEEHGRMPGDHVTGLDMDPLTGNAWVASRSGLAIIDADRLNVAALIEPEDLDGDLRPEALRLSRDGDRAWIGSGGCVHTFQLGPDRLTPVPHVHECMRVDEPAEWRYTVFDLLEASSGEVLAATTNGLAVFSRDGHRIAHHYPGSRDDPGDPGNSLFSLAEGPDGVFWVGSRSSGLYRFVADHAAAPDEPAWQRFTVDDGLADNTIYAIERDEQGLLWLSSNRGLSRYDPDRRSGLHFTRADGLQSLEFNHTVSHVGPSGTMYFGGINGINAFRPGSISNHPDPPRLHLEAVRVNDRTLAPEALEDLELRHDQNYLVIDFVGLHFVGPERNAYAYRLAEVESDWVHAGSLRQARYPNLAPGRYRFLVRAANSDGIWSEQRELLSLQVRPPPWRSPAAHIAYAGLVLAGLGTVAYLINRRRRLLESMVRQRTRQLAEKNRLVATQAAELREALEARTVLFANVSHEFRTPLTLIGSALDRLERGSGDREAIALGRRYLERLLRLVDQLLDLARVRIHGIDKAASPWPLDRVITLAAEAFGELARRKGQQINLVLQPGWQTSCSQEHVEKIVLNLLSNAVKFTPVGGRIEIRLRGEGGHAELSVSDNGPGIPDDQQDLIFEHFHRVPGEPVERVEGSGIGLALVSETARALGGTVWLESGDGQGSTFRVRLPATRQAEQEERVSLVVDPAPMIEPASRQPSTAPARAVESAEEGDEQQPSRLGTLLLVEDNDDLRRYLVDVLREEWRIHEASNGQEALGLVASTRIDVIVSDIMMPEMDGLALLHAIRDDIRTSHIPFLILTARQDSETRERGFELAADEVLGKPFNARELRLRLRNLVLARKRLRKRLAARMDGDHADSPGNPLEGPLVSRRDRQFLQRIEMWLEQHYADTEVTVRRMADDLAMDTRTLQRKLKALTGCSPGTLLQVHRIRRARSMLRETDEPVQDIALACGFSSPQYFSRTFAKSQGCTPTQFREARSENAGSRFVGG